MFQQMQTPMLDNQQRMKQNQTNQIVEETVNNELVETSDLMNKFLERKDKFENMDFYRQFELEQEIFANPQQSECVKHHGRMSPAAKEELYRAYLSGDTIKDLSLRYGILAQRVKAIVY